MIRKIHIAVIFVLISFPAFAETIFLKSGKSLEGKLVKQSSDSVRILSGNKEFDIPKRQIYKIMFKVSVTEKKQIETQALQLSKKEKEAKNKEELQKEEEKRLEELEKELSQFVKPEMKTSEDVVKKVHELETRLFELEKFTEINSDWKDYYKRKRSPWDLVWRSAILPGWGLVYAKEGYIGKAYTFLTIFSLVAVVGLDAAEKSKKRNMNSSFVNDFVVMPTLFAGLFPSSPSSSLTTTFVNMQSTRAIVNYTKNSGELHDISKAKKNALSFAVSLYFIQLIHSAIKGHFWAQNLAQTASGEIVTEGVNLQFSPYSKLSQTTSESKSELKYVIVF